jgi:hypothetical protein
VLDGGVTRVEGHDAAPLARRSNCQIAQAAAVVENPAAKIRKRLLLKRIEAQIGLANLTLKLSLEESDAGVGVHVLGYSCA